MHYQGVFDPETNLVISRADARALGRTTYYTGFKCPSGHDAERYVASRACVICVRIKANRLRRKRRQAVMT